MDWLHPFPLAARKWRTGKEIVAMLSSAPDDHGAADDGAVVWTVAGTINGAHFVYGVYPSTGMPPDIPRKAVRHLRGVRAVYVGDTSGPAQAVISKETDENTVAKEADEGAASKEADEGAASKEADEGAATKEADEGAATKEADENTTTKSVDRVILLSREMCRWGLADITAPNGTARLLQDPGQFGPTPAHLLVIVLAIAVFFHTPANVFSWALFWPAFVACAWVRHLEYTAIALGVFCFVWAPVVTTDWLDGALAVLGAWAYARVLPDRSGVSGPLTLAVAIHIFTPPGTVHLITNLLIWAAATSSFSTAARHVANQWYAGTRISCFVPATHLPPGQ